MRPWAARSSSCRSCLSRCTAFRRRSPAPCSCRSRVVMAALSRWAGGLLDRFGARLPLIIGPAIAALGFVLLALPGAGAFLLGAFLAPMIVLGLGMAITVAPLTTVDHQRRAGAPNRRRVGDQQCRRVAREPARDRDLRRGRACRLQSRARSSAQRRRFTVRGHTRHHGGARKFRSGCASSRRGSTAGRSPCARFARRQHSRGPAAGSSAGAGGSRVRGNDASSGAGRGFAKQGPEPRRSAET